MITNTGLWFPSPITFSVWIGSMQALHGFTPDEIYFNDKPVFDFISLRQEAATQRKEIHKNTHCKACQTIE